VGERRDGKLTKRQLLALGLRDSEIENLSYGRIQHIKLGGDKPPISGARGEGVGVGSLETGSQPPPHQLANWGSAVSSPPSGVRGGTLATKRFSCILGASG